MWLEEKYSSEFAITIRNKSYTYTVLYEFIRQKIEKFHSLEEGIVIINDSMSIEFIVNLFALLSIKRPVAIFSSNWSNVERETRLGLLGQCCEIDNEGNVVFSSRKDRAQIHNATRLILFTTGSTGLPKAVQLSETNIRANTKAVIDALEFHKTTSQTLFLPLSYSYGLLGQLFPALELGMQTTLVEQIITLKDDFEEQSLVGMLSGVPSHFEIILKLLPEDFKYNKITHIITAGAYTSPELRKKLLSVFTSAIMYNNYGQTEVSPRILCMNSRHPLFLTSSTGYPVGDLKVKLDEHGVLLVKGSQVMLGYLGDEQSTQEKIQDSWLDTGDIAQIAEDGLVTILGRNDELFNIGGERTSRFEIENAIRKIPEVKNVGVLIVPDKIYGTKIIAYIEASSKPISTEDIKDSLGNFLSKKKIPKEIYFISKIPVNTNGKLDKKGLKALYLSQTGDEG